MHYAILTSIVVASLLGAAAMSVVQAADAPQTQEIAHTSAETDATETAASGADVRPVSTGIVPVQEIRRPERESYYGQGFESRGIDTEQLPRGGPVFGSGRDQ